MSVTTGNRAVLDLADVTVRRGITTILDRVSWTVRRVNAG